MTRTRIILLVEDNPDDADLTVRAFEKSKALNEIVVVHHGEEALDYLFAAGSFTGRGTSRRGNPTLPAKRVGWKSGTHRQTLRGVN